MLRTLWIPVTLSVLLVAFPRATAAQNSSVVVLEESDFEKTPDAAPVGRVREDRPSAAKAVSGNGEVHRFDPNRDARADIRNALQVAAREGKHVLLDVGGDWCTFCKVLDNFFDANPDLTALRSQNFVYVKVNFSEENQNQDALESYPLIRGFPHFYVLDSAGNLIASQRVALLGTRTGYSPGRFQAFFRATAPKQR